MTDHIAAVAAIEPAPGFTQRELRGTLVKVPGGFFDYGARKSSFPQDMDTPRLRVKLDAFLMSPVAVTNAAFRRFVDSTGYVTVAEREGWSFVFHLLLRDAASWPQSPPGLPWWRRVEGACWKHPTGPESDISERQDHPVVHIAWYDALAYCHWSGLRLPSEVEWERAARGGIAKMKFPWGNAIRPGGTYAMNTWQGVFPHTNTAEDGYIGTAPVNAFAANGYGLYNMTGNVWEWVRDAFGPRDGVQHREAVGLEDHDIASARVQRGGSYLCHASYCDRYHVHSRTGNDPDSSTGNCGFRIAACLQTP